MYIIIFSSGSVIVNVILNFNQDLKITLASIKDLGDTIVEGMSDSLFIIDTPSMSIQPIGKQVFNRNYKYILFNEITNLIWYKLRC